AAPYKIDSLKVREGLKVYCLFFEEDQELAPAYLKKAVDYIKRYEEQLGPFPYNHYLIAESPLPVGYGMDTFTLLGQMVIRLPFIKDTSLGHEILHSWFGNSIQTDYASGNWCEGLTTYLADQAYLREKGQGPDNRKNTLINHANYVKTEQGFSLKDFQSASHNQPMAKAIRAIGYGRGAMLFHELQELIGEKTFTKGLRRFYNDFKEKDASWHDIRQVFAAVSSIDLDKFFQERLTSDYIAQIKVENIDLSTDEKGYTLSFQVIQQTEKPFSLQLPIVVHTVKGELKFTKIIDQKRTAISLSLQDNPLAFVIDPAYDLMRKLGEEEVPPVLSRFFGADQKLVVLESEAARELFSPLIKHLQDESWQLTTAEAVKNEDIPSNSVLFLGTDNKASRALFAVPEHPKTGFTLDVRKNPLNGAHVVVLVNASSKDEVRAVRRKLSHYGKYSYLHFNQGKIEKKITNKSQAGLKFELDRLPAGGPTSASLRFDQIIQRLKDKQVVYVGETHTSAADHNLQFRIIESLHKENPNLAIGMEMFPSSSQEALDEYIGNDGQMNERDFLKKSHYFKVWRYDFRLFRPIFNFAVHNKIPIIGLNLEREIVSNIYKQGSTDKLAEEHKNTIPVDRKLDMAGYAERLKHIHQMHTMGHKNNNGFAGFIQSQALWDETMAENISNYLKKHPKSQMVVLAGAQHTRKDSGIPPRVARRLPVEQASVLNISSNQDTNLAQQADYYFIAAANPLVETAKIGVILAPIKVDEVDYLQISEINPHGNAKQAGLLEKDILLGVDNYPINTMEDVRIAMIDATEGQLVKVKIKRGGEQGKELEFEIKLHKLSAEKHHP
ncbi:MAG: ChaN family lipoprotein, partial [Desulfobulbaceae bacterium]|nr:ChaN family lipoprotein [Desulfobulbaceae bacterium]